MSAWHLLWIVPLSMMVGIVLAALLRASGSEEYETQKDETAGD